MKKCWGVLLAFALAGCGEEPARTVTVHSPTPAAAGQGPRTLSKADSARVARARAAIGDYCEARAAGARPSDEAEVAALAVLITIFARNPNARFSSEDPSLGLANVLMAEADGLAEGNCDPKGARLLKNAVEAGIYGRGP